MGVRAARREDPELAAGEPQVTGPAIERRGLRKSYGEVVGARGVDLTVPRGTVYGLLGPNGAGKTTVVRILTTLLPPDGGSDGVDGIDVVRTPTSCGMRIGVSGQYAAVDENLTGAENLEMVGRLYHLTPAPRPATGRASCSSSSSSPRRPTAW